MPKNLVILESPGKVATIKSFLGSNYKVVASVGHVRDLPKSKLGVDIDDHFAPQYINIRGKGDVINGLKKDAKEADNVYFATDADREGEAISWHIAAVLGIAPEKTKRVTFNSITKNVVKEAIKSPRPIDMELVNSQQARRILDRIVGYKLSPYLWKTVRSGLSAGRVQSVATRIIVERENEIRAFVPEEYWTITAQLDAGKKELAARFWGKGGKKVDLKNQKDAAEVVSAVTGKTFDVASVKKSVKLKNAAPPFITSTLQQEASRRLGFPSAKTMKVAQELYEGISLGESHGGTHGLITYMRTDSLRVEGEAADAAREFIKQAYGAEYYPQTPNVYKTSKNAQDAHEAIRPTDLSATPESIKSKLTNEQYKLYKLIFERFVASQMAPAKLDTVVVEFVASGYNFRSSGYTVAFKGYMAVYDDGADDGEDGEKSALPPVSEGQKLTAKAVVPEQHFTEPPPRYTEGSLVKFLEENGIGRPSTYATIVSTIITRDYVKREGKALRPTELGEVTTDLMIKSFPDVVDYKFTARMEDELDSIADGKYDMEKVLTDFYTPFAADLTKAEGEGGHVDIAPEITDLICDKCGAQMVVRMGRRGKFAACPNYPTCKNTMPLDGKAEEKAAPIPTDMVCEKCGSPMVIRTGRYGKFYSCTNYPKCKNAKPIITPTGIKCPKCGTGEVVPKRGKKSSFWGCSRYPDCDFVSFDEPLAEKCPKCGQILYRKKNKSGVTVLCKACDYKRTEAAPVSGDGGGGDE